MKTLKKYILIVILACFAGSGFAQNFEGVITLTAMNEQTHENARITWTIKGNNHKMEYNTTSDEGSHHYILLAPGTSSVIHLLTDGKEGNFRYDVPVNQIGSKDEIVFAGGNVREMGGSRLVAGTTCKSYEIYSGSNRASCFVGEIAGLSLSQLPQFMKTKGIFPALLTAGISGFPLEFTIYDHNGEIVATQSVISIQSSKIGSAEFDIPSGYEKKGK